MHAVVVVAAVVEAVVADVEVAVEVAEGVTTADDKLRKPAHTEEEEDASDSDVVKWIQNFQYFGSTTVYTYTLILIFST